MLGVYTVHFIVSTADRDQADNPNRACFYWAPCTGTSTDLSAGRTIWFFAVTRHLYKPRRLPDFYVSQEESVFVKDLHLTLYVYTVRL